jgi:hypothetical protein
MNIVIARESSEMYSTVPPLYSICTGQAIGGQRDSKQNNFNAQTPTKYDPGSIYLTEKLREHLIPH